MTTDELNPDHLLTSWFNKTVVVLVFGLVALAAIFVVSGHYVRKNSRETIGAINASLDALRMTTAESEKRLSDIMTAFSNDFTAAQLRMNTSILRESQRVQESSRVLLEKVSILTASVESNRVQIADLYSRVDDP